MEPTKVASSQGTQPAHTTRAKSSAQTAAADASDPAAGGDFLALLAALGDEVEEGAYWARQDRMFSPRTAFLASDPRL